MKQNLASSIQALLGVLVGVLFIYLVLRNVDIGKTVSLVGSASLLPLAIAFLAFITDFLLRAVRFWAMLRLTTGRQLSVLPTIGPFIASFGISDILPLRIGDGLRVFWFSRQFRIPAGTVVGTMIVERLLDLITIVILGGVALGWLSPSVPPALMWNFASILLVAFAAGLALLLMPAVLCRALEWFTIKFPIRKIELLLMPMRATSSAILQMGSWRHMLGFVVMSLGLWLLESVVIMGAWASLGGTLSAAKQPFVAFVFSTLGTLVPSLPGHFGPFEFFGLQAFKLAGVDDSFATAVLLLSHLILWAPTAIFGIFWLLINGSKHRSVPEKVDATEKGTKRG